jgi:hypothetical protein
MLKESGAATAAVPATLRNSRRVNGRLEGSLISFVVRNYFMKLYEQEQWRIGKGVFIEEIRSPAA